MGAPQENREMPPFCSTLSYRVNPTKAGVIGHGDSPYLQGECPTAPQQAGAKTEPKAHHQQP